MLDQKLCLLSIRPALPISSMNSIPIDLMQLT